MKRIKYIKLITLFILCALSIPLSTVKADSGWDSGYDGGYSSSSSSSWDYSPSYDNSSSYDYHSSGSSSSYSSSTNDNGWELILIIIWMILVFYPMFISIKSDPNNNMDYINKEPDIKDISLELLEKYLPGVTLENLKIEIFNKFIDIQNAWMKFDYDKLKELCTDELYNTYKSQLETLKIKNGKNIMSSFLLNGIRITNITLESDYISLEVFMNVSFYDYVIDVSSNKVIRGTKNNKITNSYMMTFIKNKEEEIDKCPNCGAELKDASSVKCEYCHSDIVRVTNHFILSKKNKI